MGGILGPQHSSYTEYLQFISESWWVESNHTDNRFIRPIRNNHYSPGKGQLAYPYLC